MTDFHSYIQTYAPGVEVTDFQMPDKTFATIEDLLDILKIHWISCVGSQVQTSPACVSAKIYNGNFWCA